MNNLKFDYVPLTFISNQEEIKKQIRNTLILIYLFEKYNSPVRLEKLIEGTQYGYNASALKSGNNKFLRISDIHESKVNWEKVPYCNCDDEKKYLLKNDDILIARTGGTTGKSFKIVNPPVHSIYAGYLIRIRAKKEVNPDYLYMFLHSFTYWSQITDLNERNFRPKANAENLKSLILPDCLKNIQDDAVKISKGELVKGYEELHIKIQRVLEKYDKTQEIEVLLSDQLAQLENLNQSILREAVEGLLVDQNPDDEPAIELLKRIEKHRTPGKKLRSLFSVKPEEILFEIPKSWTWSRIGELAKLSTGNSINESVKASYRAIRDGYDYIGTKDVSFDGLGINYNTGVKIPYSANGYRVAKANSILVCIEGGSSGKKIALTNKDICFVNKLLASEFDSAVNHLFFYFFFQSNYFKEEFIKKSKGLRGGVSINKFKEIIVPVPPISEQKRIVIEIEKQLAKTKKIKEHIIENQNSNKQLLKALLHEAFKVQGTEKVLEEHLDLDLQMALVVAQIKNQLGINYGEVALQKTIFNSSIINPIYIKPYSFINYNFGTYSYELHDDLKANPYLTKHKVKGREVYIIKPEYSDQLNQEILKGSNKPFLDGLNKVLKLYELPFINKETDKIELLNTVLKVSLDKKTAKVEEIYQAMKEWRIDQKNTFKTKADKFSFENTEIMLRLLIKNGILNE